MPITVTAGEMHQLVSTPRVQLTTIPITIPVTSIAGAPSVDIQSQLWVEGRLPDEEERVVEVELDQEQEDPQEEDSQEEVSQEEDEVQRELEAPARTEEEGSSEESSMEKTRREESFNVNIRRRRRIRHWATIHEQAQTNTTSGR